MQILVFPTQARLWGMHPTLNFLPLQISWKWRFSHSILSESLIFSQSRTLAAGLLDQQVWTSQRAYYSLLNKPPVLLLHWDTSTGNWLLPLLSLLELAPSRPERKSAPAFAVIRQLLHRLAPAHQLWPSSCFSPGTDLCVAGRREEAAWGSTSYPCWWLFIIIFFWNY